MLQVPGAAAAGPRRGRAGLLQGARHPAAGARQASAHRRSSALYRHFAGTSGVCALHDTAASTVAVCALVQTAAVLASGTTGRARRGASVAQSVVHATERILGRNPRGDCVQGGTISGHAEAELQQQLAAGLCSMAELRMASADDIAEVAPGCEQLLQQACSSWVHAAAPLSAPSALLLASLPQRAPQAWIRAGIGNIIITAQPNVLLYTSVGCQSTRAVRPRLPGTTMAPSMLCVQAHEVAASSPEPLQALAQLHFEAGKQGRALAELRQSMALWWHGPGRPGSSTQGAEGAADAVDGKICSAEVPSYEFRVECCKLLIELDETTTIAVQV